ncbi:MAG: calcium/sodium antiporter, partial [Phycisphaerales bacterium]|nr:calcium/sodium antiporter [Phycisphaerales bacterium]
MLSAGLFALGILLLLAGGRVLVASATELASRFGASKLLVGLTIVAWGTSAPELALNLSAAIKGNGDLVLGNVVGSNVSNLGLVLGVAALIRPLTVRSTLIRLELPLLIAMLGGMALAGVLPSPAEAFYSRPKGAMLLSAFAVYTVWTIVASLRPKRPDEELGNVAVESVTAQAHRRPLRLLLLGIVAGIVLLGAGGSLAADSAVEVAKALGVSDRVIGITIVAVGTTLPELITSIIAVRAGEADLAVGNCIGSCLFNAGMIFGLCTTIAP